MMNLKNLFPNVSMFNFLTYLDILRYMYIQKTINLKLESICINTDTA